MYCDQKEMFEHLPPDMCKKVLMHLFDYVNDKNPISDDPIVNALFAPIKHQLKRDLIKWESRASTSRENGKLGGRPKKEKPKKPSGLINNPDKPTKPVNVNVTVNDNDTVNVNDTVIKKKEGLIFPFDSEEFINAWSMWKEYKKKEHKFSYKSVVSEQAALKSLSDKSNGNESDALKIIMNSIENGWKGFFKINTNGKENLISWN